MRIVIFLPILFCCSIKIFGQRGGLSGLTFEKPVIDSEAIVNWPRLAGNALISNDGKYVEYCVEYGSFRRKSNKKLIILQSTNTSWKKELNVKNSMNAFEGFFSADSKRFIYLSNDTIFFMTLGTDKSDFLIGVNSLKELQNRKGEWALWQLKNLDKELVLHNFIDGKEKKFSFVLDYTVNSEGTAIVVRTRSTARNDSPEILTMINLADEEPHYIWKTNPGQHVISYSIDKSGTEVVFELKEQEEKGKSSIWYFKTGMERPAEKVNPQTPGMTESLSLDYGSSHFSDDGRYIYFMLRDQRTSKSVSGAVLVDIWNYRDKVLQSVQQSHLEEKNYLAVISTEGNKVIQLEGPVDKISAFPSNGDYVICKHDNNESVDDRFWIMRSTKHWLVSLKDGSRKILPLNQDADVWFSPNGENLVWFCDNNYYSYDIKTGKEKNISARIPRRQLSWFGDNSGKNDPNSFSPIGFSGWQKGDSSVLVYDEFDVWKLDLSGKFPPENITRGYGRSHHIKFRLLNCEWNTCKYLPEKGKVLLSTFCTLNKFNGFYNVEIEGGVPEKLIMGPWTLYHSPEGHVLPSNSGDFEENFAPLQATGTDIWLVQKCTATEAPNYFVTNNFKTYSSLTQFEPQKKYNWLTSELVNYTQTDGTTNQGILYKPENFDGHKKYPVIIHYYEQVSQRVDEFPAPDFTSGDIDIAWFVSRGYLVFTPDIFYRTVPYTFSLLNSVEGAARYLAKLPFVNRKKIGITGQSWGGAETMNLVSKSHLFAAAMSSAEGQTAVNWIQTALGIIPESGGSALERFERETGYTIWQRPDLYINNSPVMYADRITTPLLIHKDANDQDPEEAVEMYLALRRLGKPVWMLRYDHGGHVLRGKNAEDFTTRVTQFFDHYLKDSPAPVWMTIGVPARMKGIDMGLELDQSGRQVR